MDVDVLSLELCEASAVLAVLLGTAWWMSSWESDFSDSATAIFLTVLCAVFGIASAVLDLLQAIFLTASR